MTTVLLADGMFLGNFKAMIRAKSIIQSSACAAKLWSFMCSKIVMIPASGKRQASKGMRKRMVSPIKYVDVNAMTVAPMRQGKSLEYCAKNEAVAMGISPMRVT